MRCLWQRFDRMIILGCQVGMQLESPIRQAVAAGDRISSPRGGCPMSDQWMIRGTQFANCNCAWGCPCQFNSPSTHGHCEAIEAAHIEEGSFNDVRLDGLDIVMLV